MNTNCRNCEKPMPPVVPYKNWSVEFIQFMRTWFVCDKCGHLNRLNRRKGYKEWAGEQ